MTSEASFLGAVIGGVLLAVLDRGSWPAARHFIGTTSVIDTGAGSARRRFVARKISSRAGSGAPVLGARAANLTMCERRPDRAATC